MLYNSLFAAIAVVLSAVCVKYTAFEVSENEGYWNKYVFFKKTSINLLCLLLTLYWFYHLVPPLINKFRNPISIDDFRWYYAASKAARDGLSPYALETFTNYILPLLAGNSEFTPFVYPPTIIPLILPLSYFSYDTAARVFLVFDILSVLFLLYGATLLLDCKRASFKIYCLCACSLIFGVTWSVRLGNISIIVSSLVVWVVLFARHDKNTIAGILLGVSTLKPTLSLLFMFYFLLKKRFTLLGWSMATSLALTAIGLWISNTSVVDFIYMYRAGAEIFFQDYWNSVHTSLVRIDAGVIGPRIFPNNAILSNLLSNAILLIFTALIAFHIYRSQEGTHLPNHINLSDVSLLACLSLLSMYSQPQNTSILVLTVVFLLNCASGEILPKKPIWSKVLIGCAVSLCLIVHTHLIYGYVLRYTLRYRDSLTYFAKISIVSIPSYGILGLTLCVLILARRFDSVALPYKREV